MSKPHPLGGIIANAAAGNETFISEHVERWQAKSPWMLCAARNVRTRGREANYRIRERLVASLADTISNSVDLVEHPELLPAIDDASLVPQDRLEIDVHQHRIRTELGPFDDKLRLLKD